MCVCDYETFFMTYIMSIIFVFLGRLVTDCDGSGPAGREEKQASVSACHHHSGGAVASAYPENGKG